MVVRRRIVFVADDLGCTAGVNDGIAAAARAGLVREASVMVTGAAVAAGVQLGRELGLGLGLHLCCTQGRALGGPVRGLTDADGAFLPLGRVLLACLRGRVDLDAAARECEAQLQCLLDHGVAPSHLNGHHHVHTFPGLRRVAAAAASRHGIRWLRLPQERAVWPPAGLLLRQLARGTAPVLARQQQRSLPFLGFSLENRLDHRRRFEAALARLPAGDYECMVHPRVPDAEFARLDRRGGRRDAAARAELATLTDAGLVAQLQGSGITPSRFAELG